LIAFQEIRMQPDDRSKNNLKAGAAQIDITPEPGIELTGFIARLGPSTGVHDRLFARALALESDGQAAVMMSCDLLAMDNAFNASTRAAISAATGIPARAIMICCTHTHSGPATIFLRDCGEVDPAYLETLHHQFVEVAVSAANNLRVVKLGFGRGKVAQGVQNRRQPGAVIDPDLSVIGFQELDGTLMAVLVNYTCHPVCLKHSNRMISADYPGYLSGYLQEQTGAVALFTNGATGDINPEQVGDFSFAEELGRSLADETMKVLSGMDFQEGGNLNVSGETLDIPLGTLPTPEMIIQDLAESQQQLEKALADGNAVNIRVHRAMVGWAEDILTKTGQGSLPTHVQAEIQAMSLGGVAWVGIPGEIFCELGLEIKQQISAYQVEVIGYANYDIGYIPTQQAYALGGYEIQDAFKYYGYPSVLAPEAGKLVLEAAIWLLL
jgi:neutral ceramidase